MVLAYSKENEKPVAETRLMLTAVGRRCNAGLMPLPAHLFATWRLLIGSLATRHRVECTALFSSKQTVSIRLLLLVLYNKTRTIDRSVNQQARQSHSVNCRRLEPR